MTARRRGRPPADGKTVSPESILAAALGILDRDGLDGLTMRALAARVGINPMTIYHHFKDRDGLIKALAELVYADVAAPEEGDALTRAGGLLAAYHATVVLYPALTLAIFARPEISPDHARRITGELTGLLGASGHSPDHSTRWTHILVDYTHGAALAVAKRSTDDAVADFEAGLAELLEAFARSSDQLS